MKGQTRNDLIEYLAQFPWAFGLFRTLINTGIVSLFVLLMGPERERRNLDILLSGFASVIATLVTFVFNSGLTRKVLIKRLARFSMVFMLFLFLYAIFYSYFTGVDKSSDRYVKGIKYTPEILELKHRIKIAHESGEPTPNLNTDDQLVASFGNDPRNVWEPSTVDLIGVTIHALWVLLVVSFVVVLSLLMLILPRMNPIGQDKAVGIER